ncbi:MAG TPA: IS481 family transposase, partial [Geminicoccaceae bacterium]
ASLHDRSSAPARSPHRLPTATIAAIERLRRQRWRGPRIARALGRPVLSVGTTLRRLGLGRLSALDAKPSTVRYERRSAGGLLHIDSKKLGRIGGLGHRVTGDRRRGARGLGWEHLHVAVDDATRLAYTELLPDERGPSCAGFLARAAAWFVGLGVRIERVMTDNAFAYPLPPVQGHPRRAWRSSPDHAALLPAHQRQGRALHPGRTARMALRPALGQLRRTRQRHAGLAVLYHHHRPHAGIHASTPAARLNNLLGNNS